MKRSASRWGIPFVVSALSFASIADETGWGRDHDIPDAQPPAETETVTTESLLQQVLEWLELEIE